MKYVNSKIAPKKFVCGLAQHYERDQNFEKSISHIFSKNQTSTKLQFDSDEDRPHQKERKTG